MNHFKYFLQLTFGLIGAGSVLELPAPGLFWRGVGGVDDIRLGTGGTCSCVDDDEWYDFRYHNKVQNTVSVNYRKENTFGGKAGLSSSTSSDYKERTF